MRIIRRSVLLAVMAAVVTVTASAAAQVPAEQAEKTADAAIGQLRSPVTPSHTLDFCPAGAAIALRDSIRVEALLGRSADQIAESVIARHGEQVRLIPKRSGFGLAAWLLTPLALVVGGVFIAFRVRAMRAAGPAPLMAGGSELTTEERARLDAALADFDRREDDA